MSKYIIKNCPCYESEGAFYNCVNERIEGDCQDCTSCVLKHIVDKCKEKYYELSNIALRVFANEILQLLDIQEVE